MTILSLLSYALTLLSLLVVAAAVAPSEHPLMRDLRALDRALVAKGWHALSPWWVDTFAGFLSSGCKQLVLRVGRRGGKSSSLARFAVVFVLYAGCASAPFGRTRGPA